MLRHTRHLVLACLALALAATALAGPAGANDNNAAPTSGRVEQPALEADWEPVDNPAPSPDLALPDAFSEPGAVVYTTDTKGKRVEFDPAAGAAAGAESDVSALAAGSTWWDGVCTNGEGQYTVIKSYVRPNRHKRMEGSTAKMYCGKRDRYDREPFTEAPFGIRHIRYYHKDEFAELAAMEGSTWGNWMHWAIGRTLEYPLYRTIQSSTRYCYEGRFTFVAPNGTRTVRRVIVILGKTGVRIMTSFPRANTDYCDGTRF